MVRNYYWFCRFELQNMSIYQSLHAKICTGMHRGQIKILQNAFDRACNEIKLEIQSRRCHRKPNLNDISYSIIINNYVIKRRFNKKRSKLIIHASLFGVDVCQSLNRTCRVKKNPLTTTIVGNDCSCEKSGLTSGVPEGYDVPATHMALSVLFKDYQSQVDVVNDVKRTEVYDSTNRPRVIFG